MARGILPKDLTRNKGSIHDMTGTSSLMLRSGQSLRLVARGSALSAKGAEKLKPDPSAGHSNKLR